MAAQSVDPKDFNAWEDAFQHPLPIVRRLEQQLRKNIDEKREKLRSLIGASYRDLLGTAERIIEMDDQMQDVETHLGEIGRKCNTRAVERVGENHGKMERIRMEQDRARYTAVAQTKVLQRAMAVVTRITKTKGDALLAAKLLLLARLLHKSISDAPNAPVPADTLRLTLASLRKKLLSYVDTVLLQLDADRAEVTSVLCAYALATRSAPADVLRHFLQIRFQALQTQHGAALALDIIVKTLQDAHDIFPRRFSHAAAELAKLPLLQDLHLCSVSELGLDVHGLWIADSVHHFTPWVRHDQLNAAEAGSALASWMEQSLQSLLEGLKFQLAEEAELKAVLTLRKSFLMKYLNSRGKIRQRTEYDFLQALRSVFVERLFQIAASKTNALSDAVQGIECSEDMRNSTHCSLWTLAATNIKLDNGARDFRKGVSTSSQRLDLELLTLTSRIDRSLHDLDSIWAAADGMRSTRWDDEYDLELNDRREEKSPQLALSQEDGSKLQQTLRSETGIAFDKIYRSIEQSSRTCAHASSAPFVLRILREVDRRKRALADRTCSIAEPVDTPTLIVSMQQKLAQAVTQDPLQAYRATLEGSHRVVTALWEGSPPLPVQPSPATFKFLLCLHRSMAAAGSDLWSTSAVAILKSALSKQVFAITSQAAFANLHSAAANVNGHKQEHNAADPSETPAELDEPDASDSALHDKTLQMLFDLVYIQTILSPSSAAPSPDDALALLVQSTSKHANLHDAQMLRLRRSAAEYWKKTYLLFGLLATAQS